MEDTTDRHLVKPIGRNKGEVDARPLESVKAALSLFGESVSEPADGRKLKISCAEKNMAKDRDVFLVQNALNMSVEQLEDSEDTELQHQLEMDKAKVVLEAFTSKLEEAKKSKEKAKKVAALVKKLEAANPHFIEAYNKVLKEELSAAREQHMMATAELENLREELKKTEENVSTYKKAEGLALKQVDKATMAAEKIDMMLDKLVKEIAATNESLALLKWDYIEAEKEKVVLLAAKEAETRKLAEMAEQNRKQLEALGREVDAAKDLEAYNKVLKEELSAAREQHMMATAELENVREELKKTEENVSTYKKAKGLALKQVDKATMAAEKIDMMLDKLVKEIVATNESLALLKLDYIEAEKEKAVLLAAKEAETQKLAEMAEQNRKQLEALGREVDAAKDLEAYNKVLKEELSAAREQHMMATAELENVREELKKTEENVSTYKKAEGLALKQVDKATMAAEKIDMMLDKLVKEIAATNESLALLKLDYIEAEKEKAVLLEAKEAETQKLAEMAEQNRKQLEALGREVDAAKDLETKLKTSTSTIEELQQDLHLAKESEYILAKVVADATQSINDLKLKSKQAESDAAISLTSISAELEEAKGNLKKTTEECNSLRNSEEFLRAELEQIRKEMHESREREAEFEVSIALLNAELHKSRSLSAMAAAAEAKAKVAALELSVAIKQLAKEAERAKEEAKVMKEEARQANLEAEHTKANLTAAEARLQDVLKEAEEMEDKAQVMKEESRKEKLNTEKLMAGMTSLEVRLQDAIKMVERMTEEGQAMKEEARKAKLEAEQAKAEMTSLELKLKDALMEGEATKEEVQAIKEEAGKANSEAEEAKADKATLVAELQDTLEVAKTEKEAAQSMQEEARKAKLETEQAKAEMTSLELRLKYAIMEGKATKEEVQAMKEQADKANSEAVKAKAEKATLEVELQDAVKVAETEKEAAQAMREEAKKAKLEIEQSKADISSVEARLQDAIKDSKAARIAEAAALSKLKSLYEEKDESMNAHKFFTGITISPDEYSRMMRKMNESNIKAAEIREGAKEGDEELLSKLEMANKEIEGLKLASERASMRADKAEIGRRAIENELRKWRKRAYEAGYGTLNEQAVQNNDIIPKPPVAVIKPLNAEPLSKFLNIKIQSSDELQSSHSNTNAITNANANANDVTGRKRNRIIASFIKKKT